VGVLDNTTNGEVFTSCSLSNFQLDGLYNVWIGRLSGLLLSGQLFDFLINHSTGNIDQYRSIFGLYHGLWLFLLFLVVILALRHSLLINLGIFAGLMYNFLPASGLYFYPWDIPATLFFTLAVLLFERRQILLMAAATCVGCFFKETVLVCALLVLFAGQWKWWKRILAFAGMVAVYVLGKKLLLNHLHITAAVLSMNDATNLAGLLNPRILIENFKVLFSPVTIYVIFANAGTMAAVLVLGWRRRFLPYMVIILAFLAGQVMYGAFLEFRIFMQILPLSLILLSERWRDYAGSGAVAESSPESASRETKEVKGGSPTKKSPEASAPGWAARGMFPVFLSTAVVLMVLSTADVAWRYYVVLNRDNIERVNNRLISKGNTSRLETACAWFQNGYVDAMKRLAIGLNSKGSVSNLDLKWFARKYSCAEFALANFLHIRGREMEAMDHCRTVLSLEKYLDTSNGVLAMMLAAANNNVAWSLATASDPHLRNGDEAVRLSERACQLTQYKKASMIETLSTAYAEAGRFNDAVVAAQKAHDLASACGGKVIAERTEQLLKLYKSGQAYHQEANTTP